MRRLSEELESARWKMREARRDAIAFQRHRDAWRAHAYGLGPRPDDFLDGPGEFPALTCTERLERRPFGKQRMAVESVAGLAPELPDLEPLVLPAPAVIPTTAPARTALNPLDLD